MSKEQMIEDKIYAMQNWIDLQIAAIKSHNKPITVNSDEWIELIDMAMKIEETAFEKFGLFDCLVITKQDSNGETYYESTKAGSDIYWSIEDEIMNKFEVIDE